MNNRFWNCKNPHQGDFTKVLCVCSAGLLRSPTIAWILSNEPFNFNTRAVGIAKSHALVPMDEVMIEWADVIVFVEPEVEFEANKLFASNPDFAGKPRVILNINDSFPFRDPQLVDLATEQLKTAFIIKHHGVVQC